MVQKRYSDNQSFFRSLSGGGGRILFLIFFCFLVGVSAHAFQYHSFDTAMARDRYSAVIQDHNNQVMLGVTGYQMYQFFDALYQKNNPLNVSAQSGIKIPKIIHQIWIGNQVPPQFKAFQESWRTLHPDWEYVLWRDVDVHTINWENRALMLESRNPGELSDMLRYEVLYRYGGVYVDFDYEALANLNDLNARYDFYIGIQPLDSGLVQLGIGLIGSRPGHPILKRCITSLQKNWRNTQYAQMATARTGPIFFTKIFYEYAGRDGSLDIAFPALYFYPLGCQENNGDRNAWRAVGAYAVHHWAKTWLYPDFRKPEFRTIKNFG